MLFVVKFNSLLKFIIDIGAFEHFVVLAACWHHEQHKKNRNKTEYFHEFVGCKNKTL
jgi:hypothetical protein